MTEITIDNSPASPLLVALFALSTTTGNVSTLRRPPSLSHPGISEAITGGITIELDNATALVETTQEPFDYTLDSPDFVPRQLLEFAARGYKRRNRWS